MAAGLIGFVGVGRMGGAIAERLIAAGHRLIVTDPAPEARARFTDLGMQVADDPRAVADQAAIVFSCLPSVTVSREVAYGAHGVVHGTAIRHYVETSTIGRVALRDIAIRLNESGIEVVDAPVSGGPAGARAGTLSTMVAGDPAAVSAVADLLECIAPHRFVVGATPGLAQMCKLVNNAISLVGMALACEATVVGVRAGLDPNVMLNVINHSTGRNSATADKFPRAILTRSFDYGGPIGAGPKDLQLFLDEADAFGIPTEVTAAGARLWEVATAEGDPSRDFTTLIQTIERWAGVEVDGRTPTPNREEESHD